MAFLNESGIVTTDTDDSKWIFPELGIIPKLDSNLFNYINELRNTSSLSDEQVNQLAKKIIPIITRDVLLYYLNTYLNRINAFNIYHPVNRDNINPLQIYKSVEIGDMKDIWSPVRIKNYTVSKDYYGKQNEPYVRVAETTPYQNMPEEFRIPYKIVFIFVEDILRLNKSQQDRSYSTYEGFLRCAKAINELYPVDRRITREDCLTLFDKEEQFKTTNPLFYLLPGNTVERFNEELILNTARRIISNNNIVPSDMISNTGVRNMRDGKIIDFTVDKIYYRPYNEEWGSVNERVMRYILYVALTMLDIGDNPVQRIGRSRLATYFSDIGECIHNLVASISILNYIPKDYGLITLPNNVFKKVDYLQLINSNPANGDYYKNTKTSTGNIATVESLAKYLFIKVGLKLNNLASYNPVVNGMNFIPIFGLEGSEVYFGKDCDKDVYSMFNAITGNLKQANGKKYVQLGSDQMAENLNIQNELANLGTVRNANNRIEFTLRDKRNQLPGTLNKRTNDIFGKQFSYKSLTGYDEFISYLDNSAFKVKFKEKFGVDPTSQHFIPISVAELAIRYLLGSVRTSMVPRLKYEPLHASLLQVLNRELNTNFPLGTKFLYIAFRTDVDSRVTSDIYSHGHRLADYIGENVNKGFSNKWNVTDQEILKTIAKLERLSVDGTFNEESLKVIADTIYQATINFLSEPSRVESFQTEVDRTMNSKSEYRDPDIKRYLLRPLIDDMRKNSDFN